MSIEKKRQFGEKGVGRELDPNLMTNEKAQEEADLLQKKVEAGEASNDQEAEDQVTLEQYFHIDPEIDAGDIKGIVKRKRKKGGFNSKYDTDEGGLKYTKEQIENGDWSQEDWELAQKELRKERIEKMYLSIARRYEQAGVVADSIVRLEQEQSIYDDLEAGQPVLIRGNWRMGKTSMAFALEKHRYGKDNTIRESVDRFKKNDLMQGLKSKIVGFIAKKLSAGEIDDEQQKKVEKEMEESGKDAYTFLSEWLKSRGKTAFVVLDEVIAYCEDRETMEYFASIGKLPNIRTAIVLHRDHQFEGMFGEVFKDFKTHFVNPLTLEETTRLVKKPLEGTPIEITDEAIAKIQEITGGRPMEINNICWQLFYSIHRREKKGRKPKQPKLHYDVDDVKAIMSISYDELKDDVFSSAMSTYKLVYQDSMSDEERGIIDRLIDEESVSVGQIDAAKVQPLIDTTYVRLDGANQTYRVNGELFVRVIQKLRKKKDE